MRRRKIRASYAPNTLRYIKMTEKLAIQAAADGIAPGAAASIV
jgi:hypothetical protein